MNYLIRKGAKEDFSAIAYVVTVAWKESLELLMKNNITLISGNHDLYYRYGIQIDNRITEENEIAHHHWVHDCIKDSISKDEIVDINYNEINMSKKYIEFDRQELIKDIKSYKYPDLEFINKIFFGI